MTGKKGKVDESLYSMDVSWLRLVIIVLGIEIELSHQVQREANSEL